MNKKNMVLISMAMSFITIGLGALVINLISFDNNNYLLMGIEALFSFAGAITIGVVLGIFIREQKDKKK